jgi:hypothetical protein
VHLGRQPIFALLYQYLMMDDKGGAVGGNDWKGKLKYSEKTATVPHRPPQIPHDLTGTETRSGAMGSQLE